MGKTVLDAKVVDIVKRRVPSKHYVYVIEVKWSEGTQTTVYRRYSAFFEFQCGLLEKFPHEAGAKNPADRCIPFLPGKKIFGRSQVRSVAEKRMGSINEYCQTLIRLPPKLSEDSYVLNFFEVTQDDINPPTKEKSKKKNDEVNEISDPIVLEQFIAVADYKKNKNTECSLSAGQIVEVIDKNDNGWWFVHMDDLNEGWVPATYLEPVYGSNESTKPIILDTPEVHITTSAYSSKVADELKFERGVLVEIFEKGLDGWWRGRYKEHEGLVPACYLTRYYGTITRAGEFAGATEVVSTMQKAVETTINSSSSASSGRPKSPRPSPVKPYDATRKIGGITVKEGVDPYASEPIYAPTPRKESVPIVSVRRPPPAAPRVLKVLGGQSPGETKSHGVYSEPHPIVTNVAAADSDEDEDLHDYETLSEHYMTIAEFQAQVDDGLSFTAGKEVSVITKNPSGWWYVEMGEKEGWVPSSYLEKSFRPHGYVSPSTSNSKLNTQKPIAATIQPAATKPALPIATKPVQPTATKPAIPKTSSQKPTVPVAQKPSVPVKPSSGPKVAPKSNIEGQSSVAAMAAALSKGLQKSSSDDNNNIADRCQSTGSANKPAVPRRVPSKPSNPSLRRSSSSDALNDTVKMEDLRQSKSPPVKIRLAGSASGSHIGKTSTSNLKVQTEKSPSSSTSNLSTQVKFLRKSQENLLALQDEESKSASIQRPTSPKPVPRANTLTTQTQKPVAPRVTHTLKLAELENSLQKGKKPKKPAPPVIGRVTQKNTQNPSSRKVPPPRPSTSPAQQHSYVAVADYTGEDDSSLSFKEGDKVDVIEQSDGGWWYVSIKGREGWVPSTFIEKSRVLSKPERPKPPKSLGPPRQKTASQRSENSYRAVGDYTIPVNEDSGINLVAGMIYEVIEKTDGGWWFVKHDGQEGWAPSSFLEPA